ncbi:GNAT family N-acetyltransferase [Bordetella genomosp. 5]|nr:GNAT family N-acetyltransferase [Bordetella genomosp. 5]
MSHVALHYAPVSLDDLPALAELRVAAMRESLEALGRFDPERARRRLIEGFVPEYARHIETPAERIGFYVLQPEDDALHLKHFYLWPRHCGQGHGRSVMQALQAQARMAGLPLRLNALRGSRANAFYLACGFVEEHADALDVYYGWHAG